MSAWAAVAQAAIQGASAYYGHRGARRNMKTGINMQQAFSERMSNTQYQRGVEDMKKAGINPMVAYSQGGAGTPGSGSQGASGGPDLDVGSAYMAQKRLENESKITKESVNKIKAETDLTKAQTPGAAAKSKAGADYGTGVWGNLINTIIRSISTAFQASKTGINKLDTEGKWEPPKTSSPKERGGGEPLKIKKPKTKAQRKAGFEARKKARNRRKNIRKPLKWKQK